LSDAVQTRTLTGEVHRSIRSDILSGALPAGAKLGIEELTRRYNAGSSPVREALSRLIAEGLVTAEEQKGFRTATMSLKEFREITDLRSTLEGEALRQSIARGDDKWESEIIAAFYRLELADQRLKAGEAEATELWEKRNREFHDVLVAACDSQWLLRLRAVLQDHSARYRTRSLASLGSRDVHAEHIQIRDAVLARDAATACKRIAEHFEKTFQTYAAWHEMQRQETPAKGKSNGSPSTGDRRGSRGRQQAQPAR
jgi:GntR family carbon starvation induced transcriptional regulator